MFRKDHLWRLFIVGALSLSLLKCLPVCAEDQVQLRPAPAAVNGSGSATKSAKSDFDEHLKNLMRVKRAQPTPAATGASSADTAAAMGAPNQSATDTAAGDEITISAPRLESLISVNEFLNPFSLDAATSTPITLKNALDIGLDRNLDLAISLTQTKQSKFSYYSALGKFLPDPTVGFSEYFARGHVGLPFNIFAAQGNLASGALGNTALGGAASTISSSGRDSTVTVNRPFIVMHAGGEFYAYRGGSVLFGALQARNTYRARTQGERATLSDTLLTIAQNYYNLVLADTVLQIRIDAVRTSEEQLRRNQARFHSGLATNLEVLQSKTQLSRDKQALVDQQIERRSAAITLSNTLNLDLGGDLKPATNVVQKVRLIDPHLSVGQVLQMAIDHRPELKEYEQLRLAAKKAIVVSTSGLQPTVSLSGQAYGIGPPSNVNALGVFAINANWRLKGLATVDSMEAVRAKWEARQAALQSQKELQTVCSQVRNSYLKILDKERNIAEASNEVTSAAEELRLAELRKTSGLGINLDIITAQRDYTQARVSKAQAIIDYNIAQAQLLHDTGQISIAGLTSGRLLSKSDL
ncbi:MAG: TolC family protein [Cyanobacteria bacterium SZAS-4]|nr:TolC family protein [Cyanobacteria bacterium SZAS-4]